jgi:hypothetical protein
VKIAEILMSRKNVDLSENISKDQLTQIPLPGGSFGLLYASEIAELNQEWQTERGAQLMGVGRARFQRARSASR